VRVLVVDNRDSFTFNLCQLLGTVTGELPTVVRHDEPFRPELLDGIDAVVISPGPGHPAEPDDLGLSAAVLRAANVPVLGVCLGMQAMCVLEGGVVERVTPMHGRVSRIRHDGLGLFRGVPQDFEAVRYHSLACTVLPEVFEPTAWSDDGVLMGVRHRTRPWVGVQFHPESICTEHGAALLGAFLEQAGLDGAVAVERPPRTTQHGRGALHWRRVADTVDCEAAYAALFAGRVSTWLDGEVSAAARYSFMGERGRTGELVSYRVGEGVRVWRGGRQTVEEGPLLSWLQGRLDALPDGGPPVPLRAGYVGFLGYELGYETEGYEGPASSTPDAMLLCPGRGLAVDHDAGGVWAWVLGGERRAAEAWLDHVSHTLAELEPLAPPRRLRVPAAVTPRDDDARYRELVEACQEHLRAGDSYELCLTSQVRCDVAVDAFALHRILRRDNPAPYAALLAFPGVSVVSSSPERFLRVDADGVVEAKPIKGTVARGSTPHDDVRARESLAGSAKDRAENLMITDLLRNDLGRVCELGSVEVPALFSVETYATVHQLVSTVRGRLRAGLSGTDCVAACFPGGSMTGAPKHRSLKLLQTLEGAPRGVYSGALGYFSAGGEVDLGMTIRTAVLAEDHVTIGAGGAVTVLSDAASEAAEMRLKLQAVVDAVHLAGQGRSEVEGAA
jgi:para-aminobenzoate synthetase